jgi:hypothetical protein
MEQITTIFLEDELLEQNSIEHKDKLKILNYYNIYSTFFKENFNDSESILHFENARFLGLEHINNDETITYLRFEVNKKIQIRRNIKDKHLYYVALTNNEYSDEEINNIKFIDIIVEDTNSLK